MFGHEVPYHSKGLLQQNWTFRHCKNMSQRAPWTQPRSETPGTPNGIEEIITNKSTAEFDPRCTLFLSQSRDIFEKTPCNSLAVQTCYCNIFSDNFAFVKHVYKISSCFLNPEGSTQQMALHVWGPPLTTDLAQDQRGKNHKSLK